VKQGRKNTAPGDGIQSPLGFFTQHVPTYNLPSLSYTRHSTPSPSRAPPLRRWATCTYPLPTKNRTFHFEYVTGAHSRVTPSRELNIDFRYLDPETRSFCEELPAPSLIELDKLSERILFADFPRLRSPSFHLTDLAPVNAVFFDRSLHTAPVPAAGLASLHYTHLITSRNALLNYRSSRSFRQPT
jgi:hypothetical protein